MSRTARLSQSRRLSAELLLMGFSVCSLGLLAPIANGFTTPNSYRVLLNHDVYFLHRNGTYREKMDLIIEPLTQAGVQGHSQIAETFAAKMQSLKFLGGKTISPSGKGTPVPTKNVYVRPMPVSLHAPELSDAKRMIVLFPDVSVHSRLEGHWELINKRPYFPRELSIRKIIPYTATAKNIRLTIHVPPGMHIHWTDQGGFKVTVKKHGDGEIITATLSNHQSQPPQMNAVSYQQFSPSFTASTFINWASVGNAYWKYAKPAERPTAKVRQLAAKIAGNQQGKAAVRALYNYVTSHIRWVGIETGLSGFKPFPANKTLKLGYGDCKAATALLVSLLKARHIQAEPALLQAGNAFRYSRQANLDELNHVITYVPHYHLFLDPTSGYAPIGTLPLPDLDKPVVLVGPHSRLGHTPGNSHKASLYVQNASVRLLANGTAEGKESIRVWGYNDWLWRSVFNRVPSSQYPSLVPMLFTRINHVYGVTGSLSTSNPSDLNRPFIIRAHWHQPGAVNWGPHGGHVGLPKTFKLLALSSLMQDLTSSTIKYPAMVALGSTVWNTHLQLPKGFLWKGKLVDKKVANAAGTYRLRIVPHGSRVLISQTLQLNHLVFSPKMYKKLYQLAMQTQSIDQETYSVKKEK